MSHQGYTFAVPFFDLADSATMVLADKSFFCLMRFDWLGKNTQKVGAINQEDELLQPNKQIQTEIARK